MQRNAALPDRSSERTTTAGVLCEQPAQARPEPTITASATDEPFHLVPCGETGMPTVATIVANVDSVRLIEIDERRCRNR